MSYDDTKLQAAVGAWLEACCSVGYGQVYSAALQKSFEDWLATSHALKCTPGMIAFGKELNRRGFECKRHAGLQYRTGLSLIVMVTDVVERRQQRTIAVISKLEDERKLRAAAKRSEISAEVDAAKARKAVKRRMKKETKERALNVDKGGWVY